MDGRTDRSHVNTVTSATLLGSFVNLTRTHLTTFDKRSILVFLIYFFQIQAIKFCATLRLNMLLNRSPVFWYNRDICLRFPMFQFWGLFGLGSSVVCHPQMVIFLILGMCREDLVYILASYTYIYINAFSRWPTPVVRFMHETMNGY